MQSVCDDVVGLSSPLLAEVQFVDSVIGAAFSVGRKIQSRRRQLLLHQSPLSSHLKAKADELGKRRKFCGGTKLASTYYTLLRLTYNTLSSYRVASKQG